jgi:hypothetical protein
MKKITLLFAAVLMGFSINAQSLTETSNGVNSLLERNPQDILWQQNITGTGGIVSDYFAGLLAGVYSADDFELNESNEITSITVAGFQNLANLEDILLGFELYIYADDGLFRPDGDPTMPGSGLLELELTYPNASITLDVDVSAYTFTIDITTAAAEPLILPAGTYWLVAAPVVNMSTTEGAQRWNWYNGDANLSEPVLIDPEDLFTGGFTNWTPFSSLGIDWPELGLAFIVEGEPALSVSDNPLSQVAVYPSPAIDVINIRVPSSIQINEVTLFDIQGRNTGAVYSNGTVDVSNLSRGVYMLTVKTSEGTMTQKIVKK